ncbi:MAG: energy-coupling factor ABC transporter ATP-binding protein [Cyanobacteria bacterium P01_H01_bin.15]
MLTLKDVTYHPAATHQPILRTVNLTLQPQQLGLIVGPSGSGKTTLLEILAGLATPSQGQVQWREQVLIAEQLQELSGLVFQFPERHFCGGTVLEELRLGHPELTSEEIEMALTEVGLGEISWYAKPYQLSGGQQRRLALAVQLIRQPNFLLLDEPTAGLDWSMRQQLIRLLGKLKEHWTLLVVTHDAADLHPLADQCWTITGGQVQAELLGSVA